VQGPSSKFYLSNVCHKEASHVLKRGVVPNLLEDHLQLASPKKKRRLSQHEASRKLLPTLMQAFPVIGTWTAASPVREMLVALVVMLRLVLVLVMVQLQTVGR